MGFLDSNRSPNPGQKTRPKNKKRENKKRTFRIVDFAVSADHKVKIKESKKEKVLELCQKTKKAGEHEGDSDTNYNWRIWNGLKRSIKPTGRVGNQRTNRDYSIVKIGQNIEKNPEETCCHSDSSERQSAKDGVKNSQEVK